MMNSKLRKKTAQRGETCSAKRTHRSVNPMPQLGYNAYCLARRSACARTASPSSACRADQSSYCCAKGCKVLGTKLASQASHQ